MEGNPGTEKKTEKIDSVGKDGSKILEDVWGVSLKPKRKQKKNPTRLGRMGPKSVRMFGGVLEPIRKQEKKSKSNRSVRRGLKIHEDSEKILGRIMTIIRH